jgi:hypothetical protein
MSKKIAIASILAVVIGGIAIPGGILLNDFITDLTYDSVDEGLLGIKEQGIPIIKDSVHEAGPKALAVTFNLMREKGLEASKPGVNATFFMGQIFSIEDAVHLLGENGAATVETAFFDRTDISGMAFSDLANFLGYPLIQGLSEWLGKDLNFTSRDGNNIDIWGGVRRLKYGVNKSGWWGDRLPGIFEDTYRRVGNADWPPDNYTDSSSTINMNEDRGFGFLEMIELVESGEQDQINELVGPNGYNLSDPYENFEYQGVNYTKLEIMCHYFTDFFISDTLDLFIKDFNDNSTTLFEEFPLYRPRNWNEYNVSYEDIAYYSYIEQWAKCISYDNGADFHHSEPNIPEGTKGLEPGGPENSSGIPMQAALQLWNESDGYSLVNESGINKWYEANSSDTAYNEILTHFEKFPGYFDNYSDPNLKWSENETYGSSDWGFNETDMDLIIDWLWRDGGGWEHGSFWEVTLPKLIYDEIAFEILLEQWANGTIFGDELYPDGFPLPLGGKVAYGFEVGVPEPTNMSLGSALALWNESSEYSLVTKSGLNKWFKAVNGDDTAYSELKTENELENDSMDLLLDWLPDFQHNVMPDLAQYQYSLPTDSISLANNIQLGGLTIGGLTIGLGSAGLLGNYLYRYRIQTNKGSPKSKKEMKESVGKVQEKLGHDSEKEG